jgi:polyisoprenoid-binding protein YceI
LHKRFAVLPLMLLSAAIFVAARAPASLYPSLGQGHAPSLVLKVDPSRSHLGWSLGATAHTVHGTFAVKSGELRLHPADGAAEGEIVVDAASGQSGNDSRDKKMHLEVLESEKFAEIRFRPEHVTGNVEISGKSNVILRGVLLLHGAEHEIDVPVTADLNGEAWNGTAKFDVPYVDWGLKNPSNFLLRVDKSVAVDLEFAGTVAKE